VTSLLDVCFQLGPIAQLAEQLTLNQRVVLTAPSAFVLPAPRLAAESPTGSPTGVPLAGVYAIWLLGTPFVYVGRSSNVIARWREHRDAWVWPNAAEYGILRRLPDLKLSPAAVEHRAAAELKRQGYLLLSTPAEPLEDRVRRQWREAHP